jgi:hypothetical protein
MSDLSKLCELANTTPQVFKTPYTSDTQHNQTVTKNLLNRKQINHFNQELDLSPEHKELKDSLNFKNKPKISQTMAMDATLKIPSHARHLELAVKHHSKMAKFHARKAHYYQNLASKYNALRDRTEIEGKRYANQSGHHKWAASRAIHYQNVADTHKDMAIAHGTAHQRFKAQFEHEKAL